MAEFSGAAWDIGRAFSFRKAPDGPRTVADSRYLVSHVFILLSRLQFVLSLCMDGTGYADAYFKNMK